jgi:putative colanic acid biosynthesis acetyltransferase WcaF
MDKIEIFEHANVAQEVYLCTGTHALELEARNLVTAPIVIGAYAFIFARAFVMPGISIGEHAVVGACSVVTKNVPPHSKVRGNPAK